MHIQKKEINSVSVNNFSRYVPIYIVLKNYSESIL